DQDREIDTESDQDCAETYRHHAESAEDEQSDRERDEAGEQERKTHSEERQPSSETDEENNADEQDRTAERGHDIVPHAQGNLSDIRRTPGDQNFQRRAVPAISCPRTKGIYLTHQPLTLECTQRRLIRDHEKNAHRAVRRRERLLLLGRVRFCKRFQRWRNDAQRIEPEFKFWSRRAGLDFLMQTMQPLSNSLGLQDPHRLLVCGRLRLQIPKPWNPVRLQFPASVLPYHWRSG